MYRVNKCEEYWMQQDHGIYDSHDTAESFIRLQARHESEIYGDAPSLVLLTIKKGGITYIITGSKAPVKTRAEEIVTEENFFHIVAGFGFYDIIHSSDQQIWGIYPVQAMTHADVLSHFEQKERKDHV